MNYFDIGTVMNRLILLKTRLLVTGGSGSGKSYLLRKIMEENSGQVPMIIMDIEGEFVTLREEFPFALVAVSDGDLPLSVQYADILARKIIETRLSVIIDLYDLLSHERAQFVDKFLKALMNLPKTLWLDTLIFIDEAHLFCPQTDKALSGNAVIDVMTRGRKRGLAGILSTQRLAKLHKDAAAECQNKMIGKTSLTMDMERSADELGLSRKVIGPMLRALQPGQFLAHGPAFINELEQETDGKIEVTPVKTSHEKRTGGQSMPSTPPSIRDILASLQDIPQEAEKELKTVEELRIEVSSLRERLKKWGAGIPPNDKEAGLITRYQNNLAAISKERNRYKEDWLVTQKQLVELAVIVDKQRKVIISILDITRDHLGAEKSNVHIYNGSPGNVSDAEFEKSVEFEMHLQDDVHPERNGNYLAKETNLGPGKARVELKPIEGPAKLGRCERTVLSWLSGFDRAFTKYQIAMATGYSQTSGGFKNALSILRTEQLIEGKDLIKAVNEDKFENYGMIPLIKGKVTVHTYRSRPGLCERTILDFLADHPKVLYTKAELAEITGYSATSGGFKNALSILHSLEMVKKTAIGFEIHPSLPINKKSS